jgi:transcriptional regulator with XRE-family HTH domain
VAVAIEDAGFELRDSIAWLYGSGFPKSLDVSKAIDKRGGESIGWFGEWLRAWRKQNNISQKEVAALFPSKSGNLTGCVANWELGLNLPTAEQFTIICRHFNLPFESIEEAQREVIGSKMSGIANKDEKERHTIGASKAIQVDITAPATPEAQQWQGWGTALKPAFEPVIVARKPIEGTVANNVLKWGTGGLNIDGSRIGTEQRQNSGMSSLGVMHDDNWQAKDIAKTTVEGRWPANIILDPYTAELLDEQSGTSTSPAIGSVTKTKPRHSGSMSGAFNHSDDGMGNGYGDSGGASRFFYVAKASKRDRNEGLDDLEAKTASEMTGRKEGSAGLVMKHEDGSDKANAYAGTTGAARQNFHPTVKPTSLMEYLVKLVTPPGGVVLDPFTGSGSTGKAAILQGFDFIGIELTEEYLPIIEGRLKYAEQLVAEAEEQEKLKETEKLF